MGLDMKLPELKICFDDFYKFAVSVGLIFFFGSLFMLAVLILYGKAALEGSDLYLLPVGVFAILGALGIWGVYWGLREWYQNQKRLDEKIKVDIDLAKIKSIKEISEIAKNMDLNIVEKLWATLGGSEFDVKFNKIKKLMEESR